MDYYEAWNTLRDWLLRSERSYQTGTAFSRAESIHGAASVREVLRKMEELEGGSPKEGG